MTLRNPTNVLVTGGCGFIGSAFIRRLLGNLTFTGRVVNLDALTYAANPANLNQYQNDDRYLLVQGDVCDGPLVGALCDTHQIDTLVHFAAESHVDRSIEAPTLFVQTNVMGTVQLLEVVRARPQVHFHHVSTDEVYGSLGPTGLFREDSPYQPSSPYAASKACSDHMVRAWEHTYGLSVTLSNCSNNYGPYQFPEKLIPLLIMNMVDRKPLPIYGDGLNIRDWLYVDDHVDAIWAVVTEGTSGQTYNIGGSAERTNLDLVYALIAEVARQSDTPEAELRDLVTFVTDRPGHDQRYAIDASKIQRELGWTPVRNLEAGLADTVAWYLGNADWLDGLRALRDA
ncbi:MAG: dTDP-glucose 4,6-dehydratase [Rhodobacterales bacterium]|nr:dTDP-glucose 4,6-dehydratase [Rhodobacterales bacterium]